MTPVAAKALGDILADNPNDAFTLTDNVRYVEAGAGGELFDRLTWDVIGLKFQPEPPEVCIRTWHREVDNDDKEPEQLIVQQVTAAPPGAVIVDLSVLSEWSLSALAMTIAYESINTTSTQEHDQLLNLMRCIRAQSDRRKEKGV